MTFQLASLPLTATFRRLQREDAARSQMSFVATLKGRLRSRSTGWSDPSGTWRYLRTLTPLYARNSQPLRRFLSGVADEPGGAGPAHKSGPSLPTTYEPFRTMAAGISSPFSMIFIRASPPLGAADRGYRRPRACDRSPRPPKGGLLKVSLSVEGFPAQAWNVPERSDLIWKDRIIRSS